MVDYDDIVARVAGPEGGARYTRIGLTLIVGGLLCIGLLYALDIMQYGDEGYRVGDLSGSDGDVLSIPNDEVMSYFNMALGGFLLVILMGVVFLLEGRRVLNLRTFMPWHAEARATALYAIAAIFTLIGVVGAATLWSFGKTGQEIHYQGQIIATEISMPSGAAVTVLGGLILMGLLAMVYYQMVLSVYRGRYNPRTRMMARLAGGTVFLGMAGLVVARVGLVMINEFNWTVLDDTVKYIFNWNYPEVVYLATQDDFPSSWEDLAASLKGMYWLLWVGIVLALGGCIGTSAHSLGGDSQRVRFAVALTFLGGLLLIGAALFGIMAGGNAGQAADDLIDPSIETMASSGIWAGIAGGFIAFLLGSVFVRFASPSLVLSGIGFAGARLPRPAPGPETDVMATPEEASSARPVEVSLAETGPPVGEEVPIEVEKVEPKVKKLRRPFGVPGGIKSIAAVLIVMVIIVTGAWAIGNRSGDSNNDDSWPKEKDIADLETGNYLNNFGFGFNEGETVRFDVFEEVLGPMYDENDLWIQVFCIYRVEVMVEWIDEPSQNIIIDRWTNDPDTFSIDIYDDLGIHDERSEDSNPLDGEGLVSVTWSSDTTLFGYGNSSLVTVKGREIDYEARIYADITLEDAGDSRSIVGRTEVDNGNECYITFKIYFFQYVDERLTE